MRPLMLRFQAFGAYPGLHEVDFSVLGQRGLFLVTGPTGTGKTTVFDAMVFALYGELPGARSSGGDARSHYVGDDVESFVEFEFEADGQRYRVHRTPTWEKAPKKVGGNRPKQQTKASLVRRGPAGDEPMETGATAVTAACRGIIGLESEQFQRVVLLPQGEFTRFLLAKDADRQSLLSDLFGGALYSRATDLLETRAKALDAQVGAVDVQIAHHRSNAIASLREAAGVWDSEQVVPDDATIEHLRAAAEKLVPVRDEQQRLRAERGAAATLAEGEAATAAELANRFDQAALLENELAELLAQEAEVESLRRSVDESRRGASVADALGRVSSAEADLDKARGERDDLLQSIEAGFGAMSEPMPEPTPAAITAVLARRSSDVLNERRLVKAAASAAATAEAAERAAGDAATALAAAREESTAAEASLQLVTGDLERLSPIAASEPLVAEREQTLIGVVRQREDLERAVGELPTVQLAARQALDDAYEMMAAFVATQAPRLAAELAEGEPCSVCGSTSHPAKAVFGDSKVVDHAQVEVARRAADEASGRHESVSMRIKTLSDALGHAADEALQVLEVQLAAVVADLQGARAAGAECRRLQPLLDAARARRDAVGVAEREAEIESLTQSAAALKEREEANRLAAESSAVDLERLVARERCLEDLDGVGDRLMHEQEAVVAADSVLATQRKAAADALAQSGFPSEDAAVAAVLDGATEEQATRQIDRWDTSKQTAETKLVQLHDLGVPQERPDAESLQRAATDARREADEFAKVVTGASQELNRVLQELAEAQRVGADSHDLRAERDDALIVFRTCNGKSGMGVKLERWVLAAELERVTQAASVHLGRMSNGRFRLGRKEGKVTLEIEVYDSNTGRARATSSLSGGEQFQASLSLALGLADVVGHGGTASGKTFEALFVDEGFGSLDPKALDQAIEALLMIQEGGRMVGAITHVEGMKERLHTGIEVRPRDDGEGSTLKVNP